MSIIEVFNIIINDVYNDINKYICIDSSELCHWICSYSFFLNIPIAGYIYSYNNQGENLFDIIGISALSISSYIYHNNIYELLMKYKDEKYLYPQSDNYIYFINDHLAIHLRCFLTLLTNYYNHPFLYGVLGLSFMFHSIGIYHAMLNMIDSIVDVKYVKNTFFVNNNIDISMPIAFDVCVIYMNTSTDIALPFLLTNVLLMLVTYIEPFFKINHVAIHSVLLLQTYYLCLSNIQ
jgi:hypothetical protein